jgi:hypothetical protein
MRISFPFIISHTGGPARQPVASHEPNPKERREEQQALAKNITKKYPKSRPQDK